MPGASSQAALLVLAVATVGVLHTCVPDHWAPITLIARQRGWSRGQAARVAAGAGLGHTLSTLAIALVFWLAGAVLANRAGHALSILSSLALIGFGGWIAIGALRDLRSGHHHHDPGLDHDHALDAHDHSHDHDHDHDHDEHEHEHEHDQDEHEHHHDHDQDDHDHGHDHDHDRDHDRSALAKQRSTRTALMLVLGSSPMIEGIPAFFAAARFGLGQLALMAVVFAATTIATYVGLVVASLAGLERITLGPLERYGEVLSGAFVAVLGLVFLIAPF